MKRIFVTFGDKRLSRSLTRIQHQAQSMQVFDQIDACDERNLDADFSKEFGSRLRPRIRGFGYWVWKPQIILQTLEAADTGDIVCYADVGCHLNPNGRQRLLEYFKLVEACPSGILGFEASRPKREYPFDGRAIPRWLDSEWSKGDLLNYLGVRERADIIGTPTIQSGVFFMRKDAATLEFLELWLGTYRFDFALADDTPSVSPNLDGFVEHRHDQAIFSLLAKLRNACTVSASEFWYPSRYDMNEGDWDALAEFPIHARRDLDFGPARNSLRRAKRLAALGFNAVRS